MSQIHPWHSIRQRDPNVYHDDHLCTAGNAIPSQYHKRGHRCRLRCPVCAKLGSGEATLSQPGVLQSSP